MQKSAICRNTSLRPHLRIRPLRSAWSHGCILSLWFMLFRLIRMVCPHWFQVISRTEPLYRKGNGGAKGTSGLGMLRGRPQNLPFPLVSQKVMNISACTGLVPRSYPWLAPILNAGADGGFFSSPGGAGLSNPAWQYTLLLSWSLLRQLEPNGV